jgi:hypothetical protein
VFDADGHVVEPGVVWERYLPARYRDHAPRVVEADGSFHFVCGDRVGFRIVGRSESVGAPGQTPKQTDQPVAVRGGSEPGPRIADMAIDRISAAALYPTYGLMIQGVTEREPALALCRALNDWLAEYCAHDPQHLIGIGLLPSTSGPFAPRNIADSLDVLLIHLYPRNGKLAEAQRFVHSFAAPGKPVILGETFMLRDDARTQTRFLLSSKRYLSGFLSFVRPLAGTQALKPLSPRYATNLHLFRSVRGPLLTPR